MSADDLTEPGVEVGNRGETQCCLRPSPIGEGTHPTPDRTAVRNNGAMDEPLVDQRPAGLRGARLHPRLTVAVAAAVFALIAAPIPSLTWPATAVTLGVGTVVLFLVASGRPARTQPRDVRGRRLLPWLVISAVFTLVELAALATGSGPDFPTVSALLGPVFTDTGPRVVGYFVWLCSGYWLLKR